MRAQTSQHALVTGFAYEKSVHTCDRSKLRLCWISALDLDRAIPGSNFFGKTPLFFQYSGVNAANAVNLQAKRR